MRNNVLIVFLLALFFNSRSQQGPAFLWGKCSSGTFGSAMGVANAVDVNGNVYTIGHFNGVVSFTTDLGTINISSSGKGDVFLLKHDPLGNLMWAKSFGGPNDDACRAIVADQSGNLYIAGTFSALADFDPGIGMFTITTTGSSDIYISKIDSDGDFIWAKSFSGTNEYGNGATTLAIDGSDNLVVAGSFIGTVDFDPGINTNTVSSVYGDIFLCKLSSSGNFISLVRIGGNGAAFTNDIAFDEAGNIYLCGGFSDTIDFDPGITSYTVSSVGYTSFILKLNSLTELVWVKAIEPTAMFSGVNLHSITVDNTGCVYTTGSLRGSSDLDPGPGIYSLTASGNGTDILIAKFNDSGNFVWAQNMGGGGWGMSPSDILYSRGNSIVLDGSAHVLLTGWYRGTVDFDAGPGTFSLSGIYGGGIFILKLNANGNFMWVGSMGSSQFSYGTSIALDAEGNIFTTGSFAGNIEQDFDPGPGTYNMISKWSDCVFIHKMAPCCVGETERSIDDVQLRVYPTIVNEILNVDIDYPVESEISITNSLGEIVYDGRVFSNYASINLQSLSKGIYFVTVVHKENSKIFKIIKE